MPAGDRDDLAAVARWGFHFDGFRSKFYRAVTELAVAVKPKAKDPPVGRQRHRVRVAACDSDDGRFDGVHGVFARRVDHHLRFVHLCACTCNMHMHMHFWKRKRKKMKKRSPPRKGKEC